MTRRRDHYPPGGHKRRGERDEAQRLGNELGKLPIHHTGFPDTDFLGYTFFDVEARRPEGGERVYVYAIGNRSEVRLTFYERKAYAYGIAP